VSGRLTRREIEILDLVVEGLTNVQIGRALYLSPRTVQTHVASAMKKTGTGTRTQLAVAALRRGIFISRRSQKAV